MMNSIQHYILNNWDLMGIQGTRPKKLSSMQISMGQGKRYDKGRLIHLIFQNDDSKPFLVAKFCRSKEYEHHLKLESEICSTLIEKYDFNYPPRQIHQTFIGEKLVNFEEFIDGTSFKISLDNYAASSNYSPENLKRIIEQDFEHASRIIIHLNNHAEKINKKQMEEELVALIKRFKEYYNNDIEFTNLIDKEFSDIFETLPEEAFHRIVNFDFIPQNIIINNEKVRVIDWEFSDFSTLLFLEPLRFLYYYVWELTNLKILKENDFEKIFTYLVKSDNKDWFKNLMHDFYLENNLYKFPIEKAFLIFLIFEANLQFGTTNYLEKIKQYFKVLITNFVNSSSHILFNGVEFKSGYEKRIGNLRKITDFEENIKQMKSSLHAKDAQITELTSALQAKDAQITELNSAMQAKDAQIAELSSALKAMQQSIMWQMMMFLHTTVIEKLLPPGTSRRKLYDRTLKGGRIIVNEGLGNFWWKLQDYRNSKKPKEPIIKNIEEKVLKTAQNKIETHSILFETSMRYRFLYFLSQLDSKLFFPAFEKPIVSIIILTFNKAEFTYQCLESIIAHTDIPYELILIDNGSTDETISLLDRLKNATIFKNNENLGFIKGCNQGASKAKGKYVLFLNNDIVVTPEWLSRLVSTIENYTKCGAVGCKLIWPNGELQEAGSMIWNDGSALGYGRGGNPMHPEYSYLREVDYCSGACLLVLRDLFQMLGGFDERYIPAYYEDSDLCLGIWKLGYKVVFQPNVIVFHHEFTSSSFEKAASCMETNRSKFITKWNNTIKNKLYPSSNNVLLARDSRQGNRILVLDDRIPSPDQGSGYPRAYQMLKFLGESGYKVTFFPLENTTSWQPSTNELQQLGIEVFYGEGLDFIRFAENRINYYDLIIVSRPHNMKKIFFILKKFFSNAALLYDAEALFSIREILKAKVKGIKIKERHIKFMINEEIDLLKKADIVVTVSEKEKEIILEKGKFNNVFVWGHPINVKKFKNSFYERSDILFVGGFLAGKDSPNEDAILYFVNQVFPKIHEKLSCRLFIVGINPTESIKKLSSSSIIVTGYVKNIEEYYEKCKVFIVPHRYAAGIPWKLQEAMSYGIPSVTSELIASQLNLKDGIDVLIANNSEEFAQKVIKVYQNEELWYRIQKNAIDYIQKVCEPDKMKKELNEIVEIAIKLKL